MRRVALIPARGGSKRLPRKNILDFMGKPIIAWTIEAAIQTNLFEQVVVSTEDNEIAEIAANAGAKIDKRDVGLATDDARVSDVCSDFLSKDGNNYDLLCCLYATAPLRQSADIQKVVELIEPGECDYALAATYYDLPPHQALLLTEGNKALPKWPELITKRASDVGELVVDNGSTYAVSTSAFMTTKSFYGSSMKVHIMPPERSRDIDEAHDFELAEFYARKAKA